MKKIILYIAASLDQRIAEPDGGLEWLTGFPNSEKTDYGYKELLASIDTVIMGGRTYREILNMDVIWPYSEQIAYVISHHKWEAKENMHFITENIIETISELRNQEGKDIWLVGGGELTSALLTAKLIDEIQICYFPIILGKGIPLFPSNHIESTWKYIGSTAYNSGVLKVDYIINKTC
ncbi:dihydrofolate reductase family protein [Dysgonomonas termitidis]|uniref:Dihydrofolate reductase family protein n=1 Tax=Dysgonomonas termitidis TaxID=1516126 RepID=A0ABV9L359_9BACT